MVRFGRDFVGSHRTCSGSVVIDCVWSGSVGFVRVWSGLVAFRLGVVSFGQCLIVFDWAWSGALGFGRVWLIWVGLTWSNSGWVRLSLVSSFLVLSHFLGLCCMGLGWLGRIDLRRACFASFDFESLFYTTVTNFPLFFFAQYPY